MRLNICHFLVELSSINDNILIWLILLFTIFTSTSSETYYHAQTTSPPELNIGMSSLAFVFDRTGSMYDDLVQVRTGAKKIFETVLKQRKKLIYNYVLVAFSDPVVDVPFVSSDPVAFTQQLARVNVNGGGDCPEMTLSGIKAALEVSLPSSYIYVFTDAMSKDYYLESSVIDLIQRKQSSVVFVMTGDCGNRAHPGYQVFEKIAAASFGQVFHLGKSDVKTVLEYVRHSVAQKKVHLLYEGRKQGGTITQEIFVDKKMTELTFSLSGDKEDKYFLVMTLYDPNGVIVERSQYANQSGTVDLETVKINRISDPMPGKWKVVTESRLKHTLTVKGHGEIDFNYRFSPRPIDMIELGSARPITGHPTQIFINMTGLKAPGTLNDIKILNEFGEELKSFKPIPVKGNPYLYHTTPFVPPNGFWFMKIEGIDDLGFKFQRVSPTSTSSVEAGGPRVHMPERINALNGGTAILRCIVESDIDYEVVFKKDGIIVGGPLYYKGSDTVVWEISDVSPKDRGYYSCEVSNNNGKQNALTLLDTKEPVPKIINIKNATAIIHHTGLIPCTTTTTYEKPIIQWFRKGSLIQNNYKYYIFPNGTLRIVDINMKDAGDDYMCRVKTSGGESTATVSLSVFEKPKASISPLQKYVTIGKSFRLHCEGRGSPEPHIKWYFKGNEIIGSSFKYNIINKNNLEVYDVTENDIGVYECRAISPAGYSADASKIELAVPPKVRMKQPQLLIARRDAMSLECELLEGIPTPKFYWYKNNKKLSQTRYLKLLSNKIMIHSAAESDTGNYTCKAINDAGEDEGMSSVLIGSPATIMRSSEKIMAHIEKPVMLPCRAIGHPKPTVKWLKNGININSLPEEERSRFSIMGDNSLQINSVDITDETSFTCVATNNFGSSDIKTELIVTGLEAPVLAQIPPRENLFQGKDVRLQCIVLRGIPRPKLTWLKDGIEVEESDTVTIEGNGAHLTIKGGFQDDEGFYECTASNPSGNAQVGVEVVAIDLPMIIGQNFVEEKSVKINDIIELPCEVTIHPKPKVQWRFNNKPINIYGDQYSVKDNFALIIKNVNEHQSGEYTCIVTNEAGEAKKSLKLSVKTYPIIAQSEDAYALREGDKISLPCEATGFPKPEITWYFNNNKITDGKVDSNGNLTIENIKASQRGKYKCVARNEIGTSEKEIVLNVHVAPTIESALTTRNLTVVVNDTFNLPCSANANPPPKRSWKFEGNGIYEGTINGGTISIHENGSLIIDKVQLMHSGIYECHVSNIVGEDSIRYQLDVQDPPRIISSIPDKLEVVKENNLELNCKAIGIPLPQTYWQKDGIPINQLSNMYKENNGNLKIENIDFTSAGKYSCMASNIVGKTSKTVDVIVNSIPKINKDGSDNYVGIENKEISFQCNAESIPPPQISWYFNGKELTSDDSDKYMFNLDNTLDIFDISPEDKGTYSCKATNNVGSDEKFFNLDIISVPVIESSNSIKEEKELTLGNHLTLECPVYASIMPQITWYFMDKEIDFNVVKNSFTSDENRKLHLNHIDVNNSGEYKCVVVNEAGETSKSFDVNVLIPPKISDYDKLNLVVMEKKRLKIECPVTGSPTPSISWLVNGQIMNPGENNRGVELSEDGKYLIINSAETYNDGIYVCASNNKAGSIDIEIKLEVLSLPKVGADEKIEIEKGKGYMLKCLNESDNSGTTIHWVYPNNKDTPPNVEEKFDGKRLYINGADKDLNNKVTCFAKNKAGEARKNFDITVLEAPSIIKKIDEIVELTTKQSYILECDALGTPEPTITWLKDGEILNENESFLEINSNEPGNHQYSCKAENKIGVDYKDFSVKIVGKPKMEPIEEVEKNVFIKEGGTTTLTCPISNDINDDYEIEWIHNGATINLNDVEFKILNKTKLIINDVKQIQHDIKCVVTNKAGSASQDFQVKVMIPPKVIGNIIENIKIIQGDSVDLTCDFDGDPLPKIKWYKNIEQFIDEKKLYKRHNILSIKNSTKNDEGTYQCKAYNEAGETFKTINVEVILPPVFNTSTNKTKSLVDIPVDKSYVIECPIESLSPLEILWYKDDEPISHDSHEFIISSDEKSIIINKIQQGGNFNIMCVAKNLAGEASKEFDITITEPPKILSKGGQKSVIENHTIVLHCEVSGHPFPIITWVMNGIPVEEKNGIHILSNGQQLEITNANYNHLGTYTCNAENRIDLSSISFDVDVIMRPKLYKNITSTVEVIQGEGAYFECPIDTNEKLSKYNIRWEKDDVPIEIDNDGKFTVSSHGTKLNLYNSEVFDEGSYSCIASNEAGFSRVNYNLEVLIPPTIHLLDSDKNRTVVENSNITLSCPSDGKPDPEVRWYKDGELITDANCTERISSGKIEGQKLIINNVHIVNGGRFTCESKNKAGTDERDILLTVITPPKIIRDDISNEIDGAINKRADIQCPVTGKPPPKVFWLKDGKNFELSDGVQLSANEQKIFFTRINENHPGKYTCVARNLAGEDKRDFILRLLEAPKIEGPNIVTKIFVNEGRSTILDCPAKGSPEPKITWLKNGHNLDLENKKYNILNNGYQLQLSNVKSDEEARYSCVATNDIGLVELEMFVYVILPPKIYNDSVKKIEVIENDSKEVICNVTGSEPIDIQWMKNGKTIDVGSGFNENGQKNYIQITNNGKKLHLLSVHKNDEDIYECLASNSAGSAKETFDLKVIVKPVLDDKLSSKAIQIVNPGDGIKIDCRINANPLNEIIWTKEGEIIELSSSDKRTINDGQTLIIDSASEGYEGKYSCEMSNKAGTIKKDFIISLTSPPSFNIPYENVSVLAGEMKILTCNAKGSDPITYDWTINDERIQDGTYSSSITITGNKIEVQNAMVSDTGKFICIAHNNAGEARKTFNINVLEPPRFIDNRNIHEKIVLGDFLSIDCSVSGIPKPTIIWKKVSFILKKIKILLYVNKKYLYI
uniref:Hemicentin-1 n=1 Tax=Strongyloides stercoralis TaxID=6248 RepID=A0A0K0E047_STRER